MTKINMASGDAIVSALIANGAEGETQVNWDDKELRILESRGVVGIMPITALRINLDNPRDGDWKSGVAELMDEIKLYGFDKSQPLTVLLDTPVEPIDPNVPVVPTGMVLRGNRRLSALLKMQAEMPDLFATILPDATVPVVTFSNLSATDIASLIVDHGKGRKRLELNSFELFLAVRVFVKSGTASQADIGRKLGKSRSWAQKMVALTKMPIEVRESFKPVLLNKLDETKLRMQDILFVARDYTALSADAFNARWAGYTAGTNPDGQFAQTNAAGSSVNIVANEMIDYTDLRGRANSHDSKSLVTILTNVRLGKDFGPTLDATFKSLETELTDLRVARTTLNATEVAELTELRAVRAVLTESEMAKVTKRLAVPAAPTE